MADPGKRMRLTHPDIRPAATPIRISFDGQALEALPGETIAATLSAAAAEEQSEALEPLGVTHVLLTHADQARAEAAAEKLGLPLTVVPTGDGRLEQALADLVGPRSA